MLTRKGAATRARIVDAAAELISVKGAAQTCLDDIRAATGTSKSQLFHYFPEGKAQLLLAVARLQAEQVLQDQRPLLEKLDSWEAWEEWRQLVLDLYAAKLEYCPLTALTGSFPKNDPAIRALISDLFERWQAYLAHGIELMRAHGALDAAADPRRLAMAILAAVQGGVAMGRATGSLQALDVALEVALDHLRTFATTGSQPVAHSRASSS
ncbi:TetR/AcrR family transcriptional regulator [Streptosporangium sp. NBC_01756]|uniref:TetR/AcrR family transcriptional regulator n=1 Tax=Streptosporangium sp. NBC_01756 TaxID=2975950 RepID=UPI002DDB9724|nr:TetR/AcrR family transcriptional regulator [Streptosporangium sp. NBC_01756]WSC86007.1 TetR/AcrR family transcriptional regulator [Streptosporangium sp. NBC_01756]